MPKQRAQNQQNRRKKKRLHKKMKTTKLSLRHLQQENLTAKKALISRISSLLILAVQYGAKTLKTTGNQLQLKLKANRKSQRKQHLKLMRHLKNRSDVKKCHDADK